MRLIQRPRRLRGTPAIRNMVRETRVSKSALVYPMFVREEADVTQEIPAMPGQYQYSLEALVRAVERVVETGVTSVLLFGIPEEKDEKGTGAWAEDGVVQTAVRTLKEEFPELVVITDVCLCEYTSHGHCGVLKDNDVDNDATLPLLAKMALSHARAGADIVAPSDMMDGRVYAIRKLLDKKGYTHIPVMSYAVKYASAFYGPFREAAGSAPAFGDRKSYQMDYHNAKEAIKEAALDVQEGADILIVKPAMTYSDIITNVSTTFDVPVAAYSVSGEYAMVKAAAQAGYIDEVAVVCEMAVGAFRAGADMLISYHAPELATWIDEGRIG